MKRMNLRRWIAAGLSAVLITGALWQALASEEPAAEAVQTQEALGEAEAQPADAGAEGGETVVTAPEGSPPDAGSEASGGEAPSPAVEETDPAPEPEPEPEPVTEPKAEPETQVPATEQETVGMGQDLTTPAEGSDQAGTQNESVAGTEGSEGSDGSQASQASSEAADGQTGTAPEGAENLEQPQTAEAGTESAEAKAEDPEGKENKEDGDKPTSELTGEVQAAISIGEDENGAFYSWSYNAGEEASEISFSLTDDKGNPVGSTVALPVTGEAGQKSYFLSLEENPFGLTLDDMDKTVGISMTVPAPAAGDQDPEGTGQPSSDGGQSGTAGDGQSGNAGLTVSTDGNGNPVVVLTASEKITLKTPEMIMPSAIGYTAISKAGDLADPEKTGGASFKAGSFATEQTVEKKAEDGSDWTEVEDDASFTAAVTGTYRIRIHTILKDFYSNEFKVIVPVTGLEVAGDAGLGGKVSVKALGPDGSEPDSLTFEWFYGEAGKIAGTGQEFTSSLKEAVEAKSMTLNVRVTDEAGNAVTKATALEPIDLSKFDFQSVVYEGATPLVYNGKTQFPKDFRLKNGAYEIPVKLYKLSAAAGKNSTNAGKAWMTVTGDGLYLKGSTEVIYEIRRAQQKISKSDFTTAFTYDKKKHKPVLNKTIPSAGKLTYSNWKKKNSKGKWYKLKKAPSAAGTYRVTVKIAGAGGNYEEAVVRKLTFTISSPASAAPKSSSSSSSSRGSSSSSQYVPQPGARDIIVRDQDGQVVGFELNVIPIVTGQVQAALAEEMLEGVKTKSADDSSQIDLSLGSSTETSAEGPVVEGDAGVTPEDPAVEGDAGVSGVSSEGASGADTLPGEEVIAEEAAEPAEGAGQEEAGQERAGEEEAGQEGEGEETEELTEGYDEAYNWTEEEAGNVSAALKGEMTAPFDFILEISAPPEKQEDGNIIADDDGLPVYAERTLYVSTSFVKALSNARCKYIRFVLGDAAVQIDITPLLNNPAVAIRLDPLKADDLSEGEIKTLADYDSNGKLYDFRVLRESSGADLTEDLAKTGALEVLLDVTKNGREAQNLAEILFLSEKRDEGRDEIEPSLLRSRRISENGRLYLKGTAPGSGVFGLVQNKNNKTSVNET